MLAMFPVQRLEFRAFLYSTAAQIAVHMEQVICFPVRRNRITG
jgi:hypothetical protein